MTTKLERDLRREIDIAGVAHVVTISPRGFVLTVKGRRKGLEIAWADLVSGEAALATALNASLTANIGESARTDATSRAASAPVKKVKDHGPEKKKARRPRSGAPKVPAKG